MPMPLIHPDDPDFLAQPLWRRVMDTYRPSADESHISPAGRPPTVRNAAQLWEMSLEYFEWADSNPIVTEKQSAAQGLVTRYNVIRPRPYTWDSFRAFHAISERIWRSWREDPVFEETYSVIDKIMYAQKFDYAATDVLNSNIIQRDLNLAEKRIVEQNTEILKGTLTAEQIAKLSKDARRELLSLFEEAEDETAQSG